MNPGDSNFCHKRDKDKDRHLYHLILSDQLNSTMRHFKDSFYRNHPPFGVVLNQILLDRKEYNNKLYLIGAFQLFITVYCFYCHIISRKGFVTNYHSILYHQRSKLLINLNCSYIFDVPIYTTHWLF